MSGGYTELYPFRLSYTLIKMPHPLVHLRESLHIRSGDPERVVDSTFLSMGAWDTPAPEPLKVAVHSFCMKLNQNPYRLELRGLIFFFFICTPGDSQAH